MPFRTPTRDQDRIDEADANTVVENSAGSTDFKHLMAQKFAGHFAAFSQQGQSSPPEAGMLSQSSIACAGAASAVERRVGIARPSTINIAMKKRTARMSRRLPPVATIAIIP